MRLFINKLKVINQYFYYKFIEKNIYKIKKKKFKRKLNPKITIYTPTKNRAEILISRAVKGVLSQSYKNFEYIIVGDYCNDNTKDLVTKINDPRIKYYDLKDQGIKYEAFSDLKKIWLRGGAIPANFAIKKSSGDWIARCDDDEEWTENFLKETLDFALNNDFEFVSSGSIYAENPDDDETIKKLEDHYLYDEYFQSSSFYKEGLNNCKIGAPSTWLIRSNLSFFKFNEESWRKDYNQVCDCDFINRLAFCNVNCGYLDKSLVYQLPRPGNDATGLLGALNDYKNLK